MSDTMPEATSRLLGMDTEEEALADRFYEAVQAASRGSERSQQAAAFKVGVSDLGFCSEQTRRMLMGLTPAETDETLAFIGTALGDHIEQAVTAQGGTVIRQASVVLELLGQGGRVYRIPGHPDLILPDEGVVIDVKTDYGLTTVSRTGPNQQQQFQRHGYCKAAYDGGLFPGWDLADLRVANVWFDRAGIDKVPWVQMEHYDPEVVLAAGEWLDEVIYAYLQTADGNYTEARKEPPAEMCAVVCGFYEDCRAMDTDVEGLLSERTVLEAISMYVEGMEAKKAGAKLQDEAKEHLRGISGMTKDHVLRWTWVNEVFVEATTRRGYHKIDLRPRRKPGVKKAAGHRKSKED